VDEANAGGQSMKSNYTKEEIEELTTWAIRMVKFWGVSALLYITIFYGSTLTAWILGSILVLKGIQKMNETENDDENH
jgi:hypothetical protein